VIASVSSVSFMRCCVPLVATSFRLESAWCCVFVFVICMSRKAACLFALVFWRSRCLFTQRGRSKSSYSHRATRWLNNAHTVVPNLLAFLKPRSFTPNLNLLSVHAFGVRPGTGAGGNFPERPKIIMASPWLVLGLALVPIGLIVLVFLSIQRHRRDAAREGYGRQDELFEQEELVPHDSRHDSQTVRDFSSALGITHADCCRMLDEVVSSTPSTIIPRLLLGNEAASKDSSRLASERVTHILNATSTLPNHFENTGMIQYLRIPVEDSLAADLGSHLDKAVDWMAAVLSDPFAPGAVLVHCQQGISRSATLVIAFLMRERGMPLASAVRFVHQRRWIRPNEAFIKQLGVYEQQLAAQRKGPYAESAHGQERDRCR
jgi:protein-tyrosine phosphatase